MTSPLSIISRPGPEEQREITDFAASVRRASGDWAGYDTWTPSEPCDDRDATLREELTAIGWFELADEPDALPFVAAAAVELGRAGAPLDIVDRLLGRPLALHADLARGVTLGRYAVAGDDVWVCGTDGLRSARVSEAIKIAYLDSVGAALLEVALMDDDAPAHDRVRAWVAATAGYATGLTAAMHDMSIAHAVDRAAFGRSLADLDLVAAKLADTAMVSEGLVMALQDTTGPEMARHAVQTAVLVSKTSQQLHGGLGFTLEFPLQRLSRRAWALEAWTTPVLEPMTRGIRWAR